MGTSDTAPCWVRTWASDLAAGDVIRFTEDGPDHHVTGRTHPDAWEVAFTVYFDDGTETGLLKSHEIWIHDPDGSVAARIKFILGRA